MKHTDFVYHSTLKMGLERLTPTPSTHGKPYVYATKDFGTSLLFLSGIGGDFTCAIGRDQKTQRIYVCERFEGAFELRYAQKSGAIYKLPKETFVAGKTPWIEEVVSESAVTPIEEIQVMDAKALLLELERKGEIVIIYYPNKIDGIPEDDSDLVERAKLWSRQHPEKILEQLKLYHPHLIEAVFGLESF